MTHLIDPDVAKLLRDSGFRENVEPRYDGEAHTQVKGHTADGDVMFSKSTAGGVAAIVRPSGRAVRKSRGPQVDHNGKLLTGQVVVGKTKTAGLYDTRKPSEREKIDVTYELERFPSDQTSAAVTLTRNLKMDACLRFAKTRGCSMAGGNKLLEIQTLWRDAMPAMGVLKMEFTAGSGDADNAKVKAIDAVRRLNLLAARTTPRRWKFITRMTLEGMHPAEIAQKHHITAGVVRRQLALALDDVAKVGKRA